jgi:hypothetical protein
MVMWREAAVGKEKAANGCKAQPLAPRLRR